MQNTVAKPCGVGLVLSGGGGKGAYEIGVWKALNEYGITPNITAISGTSVGALNAALFAQGDYACAEQVWSSISPEAVMTLNRIPVYTQLVAVASDFLGGSRFSGLFQSIHRWVMKRFADQGILSKDGLSTLIDKSIDINHVLSFCGPIYVAAYNITSAALVYFNLKEVHSLDSMKERMLASASIPVVFGETYIEGDLYWDGGIPIIGDNTPVQPLYNEGYRDLIVIHLSREVPVDRSKFTDCNIIEIMPQEDLGGMVSGTMNFKASVAKENILRGYKDTVRILEPIYKTGLALNRRQSAFRRMGDEQHKFSVQYQSVNNQIAQSGQSVDNLLTALNEGSQT